MKSLLLASLVFLTAHSALACLGGRLELEQGAVVLTSEGITAKHSEMSAVDMLDSGQSFNYIPNSRLQILVRVLYVKSDAGGIIETYYEITRKQSDRDPGNVEIVKIESNYRGNGVHTRGMEPAEPEFVVDQVYGC